VANTLNLFRKGAVGFIDLLDGSLLAWITAVFGVKPKALCKLLGARTRITGFERANVHLEKWPAKIESDVVRVNENGTGSENAQRCRNAWIILGESNLCPFLLISKTAQRVSYNGVVNLEAEKALLLVHKMSHVDDEKQRRMLGREKEPKQPADNCYPSSNYNPASPRGAGAYHLTRQR